MMAAAFVLAAALIVCMIVRRIYQRDIYSFGLVINFLEEKTRVKKNSNSSRNHSMRVWQIILIIRLLRLIRFYCIILQILRAVFPEYPGWLTPE